MIDTISYEALLISAIRNDLEAIDRFEIKTADFDGDLKCKKVFQAITEMIREGITEIDPVVLLEVAGRQGVDSSFVLGLPAFAGNPEFYLNEVREKRSKKILTGIGGYILDNHKGSKEMKCEIEKRLTELEIGKPKGVEAKRIMVEVLTEIERKYKLKGSEAIPTGFPTIDKMLFGGLYPGEYVIIGARTSVGKTTAALNMAWNIVANKMPVALFSLETGYQSIFERILAQISFVPAGRLRQGSLEPSDFPKLVAGCEKLKIADLTVDDTPGIQIDMIESRARRYVRNGCKIIFVDYLTIVQHENRKLAVVERVGEISQRLKNLARELGVPVVVLSQLKRESAEKKEPSREDLRWSGEIEEHADNIILLWAKDHELWAKVDKARNAMCGKVKLHFNKDFLIMTEYDFSKD